jgi:hypothetical protein
MEFNFAGLSTKRISKVDVKVLSGSRFKLGTEAMELLGITGDDTVRLFLDKDITSGKFYIAGIPVQKNEEDKIVTPGLYVNKDGIFSQGTLNHALGGKHTELEILKNEGIQNGEVTYYGLKENVNGAQKRDEIARNSAEALALESQTEMFEEEKTESAVNTLDANDEQDGAYDSVEEKEEEVVETVNPISEAENRAQVIANTSFDD